MTPEEAKAVAEAAVSADIRALAQEIRRGNQLAFTPGQKVKGIVTAINYAGTPPTMTVNIGGDTTTEIPGVRMSDNYSPVVGHTVLLEKQGAQILAVSHTANANAFADTPGGGWVTATLAAGSHNGNSGGDIMYRRILDHGSWKMQWQGGWNVSGTTVVSSLASEYRPSSRRNLLVCRNASGSNAAQVAFNTDGSVIMAGANTAPSGNAAGSWTSFQNGFHQHFDWEGINVSGTDLSHDHSVDSHSHGNTVNTPTWISFSGVEYFL